MRATVMVCVSCAGMLRYRPCLSFNTLAAAGTIVLGWNPTELFSAGAQLSFVAVAVMIWLVPKLTAGTLANVPRRLYERHHTVTRWLAARCARKMMSIGQASLAIWLLTLPLVSFHFNLMSPIALALNLFLWIPLALGLVSGLVTAALAWAPPLLVAVPAAVCRSSLQLLGDCVRWAADWEWGHVWVPGPPQWLITLFYLGLILGLGFPAVRARWKTLTGLLYGCLMMGWLGCAWAGPAPVAGLRLTFLSVGHGTCVTIQLPDGRVWLYDAGTSGQHRFAVREISRFLWSRGITRIDGVLLSHADIDHFNALPGLLRRFPIARLCTPEATFASAQPGVEALRWALRRAGVPIVVVDPADRLALTTTVDLRVCHPNGDLTLQDNEASLVLEIEYQGRRILLPGDLEGDGMQRLLEQPPRNCDLVMAPHHGSQHSAPRAFCQWTSPEWVVVSGGRKARNVDRTLFQAERARVLITARDGAIQANIVKGRLSVSSFTGS
jgi:competence protein ComEC